MLEMTYLTDVKYSMNCKFEEGRLLNPGFLLNAQE